jgi:hypothetical protein
MQIALMYISVTIADICSANGVGSMHLLGVALSRNTVALFVKALFLEVRKKYLGTTTLPVRIDLPPTMRILLANTAHRPMTMMFLTPRTTPIVPSIHHPPAVPRRLTQLADLSL